MTHQIVHKRISNKGKPFIAGLGLGWHFFADGSKSPDGMPYMLLGHREDKWSWGDLEVIPLKTGGYVVKMHISRKGKRFKYRKVFSSFDKAWKNARIMSFKHRWPIEGRELRK
jgi:hypothetical protein